MWLNSLHLQCIAGILATVYFFSATSSSCTTHRECDLNFENCEKESCTNEAEERVIVCYFTNWAWYRKGIGKFTPANINPSLCTHINYAFAILDSETLTIKPSDPWADLDNKFYQLVVDLVAKGVKVLLSIGGWNNSDARWSRMFRDATARAKFITSVVQFIKKYKFSGLDVDFEYPACPQGNRSGGLPTDTENFNKLIKELKDAFGKNYLLSVTVAAGEATIKECYNMPELCQIPDWINVMTYDYHSYSEGVVGANAPISGTGSTWGVHESLTYLTKVANCPAKQLVLGVPFYGQSYTLADASTPQFGVKASGPGDAGTYTQSKGTLAYYEICLNQRNGWKTGWSNSNDSYAWRNTQFVSFDNINDVKRKSCLINKDFGLRGAMIWSLDFDDFTNSCGGGVYPLLTTLNQQLRCLNGSSTSWSDVSRGSALNNIIVIAI